MRKLIAPQFLAKKSKNHPCPDKPVATNCPQRACTPKVHALSIPAPSPNNNAQAIAKEVERTPAQV
jgi:hypothetical protein